MWYADDGFDDSFDDSFDSDSFGDSSDVSAGMHVGACELSTIKTLIMVSDTVY